MAETDRLELEIATKIDKRGAEKVATLAKAIRSLNSAVTHFKTTNFSAAVSQMSDSLKDFLATAKNSEKSLVALASILKKASSKKAAQKGVAANTAIPAVSEVKEQLTLLDVYKKRLQEIQNDLKNQNLTTEQRNALLAQELDYQEKIKNYQPMDSSNPENQKSLREMQLLLEKISLAYQNIAIIERQIAAGNVSEEQKNSLLDKRASKLLQIEKWLTKIEALQNLAPLGKETINTGDEVDTTPAPKIKPVGDMGVIRQISLFDELRASIRGTNKEAKKFLDLSGTKVDKFGKALQRIELYRAIRAILKDVQETVKSTFDYASSKFPEFNKALSQFKSSSTIISAAIGQILVALLPASVPILQFAATLIANIANVIMKMSAALRGSNKYMQINTKYFKDQQEAAQGTLLAFDTFTTLAVKNEFNPDDIFQSKEMSSEEMEKTKKSANTILATLRDIVALWLAAKLAKGVLKVFDAVDKVKKALGDVGKNVTGVNNLLGKTPSKAEKIQSKLFDVAMVAAVLLATFTSFSNLFDVIDNWDEKTLVQKITAIASAVAATVGLIAAGMALLNPTMAGIKAVKAVAVGASLTSMFLTAVSTSKFADGGMFEGAGTMYAIAGESGAEVVAKGSQGTGVLNVEQFKTAMVQAFYEYGAARGDLSAASVTLNGEKVGKMTASSSYREMVRQGLL